MTDLEYNFNTIKKRIESINSEALLVAVSKGQSSEKIRALYHLGQRDFSENYVQEWQSKKTSLRDLKDIKWHFTGHVQTNKIKYLNENLFCIQTIDSLRLAHALVKNNLPLKVLLQLCVDKTDLNKFGLGKIQAAEVYDYLRKSSIEVAGFMGIGPLDKTEADLKELYEAFVTTAKGIWDKKQKPILSLGMSDDFELALKAGSNCVRIGSKLFGERPSKL